MYAWALRRTVRWACRRLNGGDFRPVLALFARDAEYRYYGEHLYQDELRDEDGTVIYSNRGVHIIRARWGRIVADQVFSDTQRIAALDEYMADADRVAS